MAIYRNAASGVRMGATSSRAVDGVRMGDWTDSLTSGLTAVGTHLVDDLTGKGGSKASTPPLAASSSSSSPWPWIAGLAGGAVALTLILRR